MGALQLPTHLDPCHLVIEIESEPFETGQSLPIEVRFIDEDGRTLSSWNGTLELPPTYEPMPQRTFVALRLPWDDSFVFHKPGTYRFDVVIRSGEPNERVLGGETLTVVQGPPPAEGR